nr:VIT family protein [Chelatococcus asaccharovorans]
MRAAVLGANDGIISTASLVVGVAAAATAPSEIIVAGIAGMIAGAMSMAAGEYVSVSSQADTERADLARERRELAADPRGEEEELAQIYVGRGLAPALAREVAVQLMAHDALEAHARDELGITATATARPVQAALASATTFTTGAIVPILAAIASPASMVVPVVFAVSVALLALLGALGARAGGASLLKPTLRVALWGALAMAVTAGIGALIGKAV